MFEQVRVMIRNLLQHHIEEVKDVRQVDEDDPFSKGYTKVCFLTYFMIVIHVVPTFKSVCTYLMRRHTLTLIKCLLTCGLAGSQNRLILPEATKKPYNL